MKSPAVNSRHVLKAELKLRLLLSLCLILPALALPTLSLADKVYVRDVLYVPLRAGQSTSHRILHQGIRSGTVLERLERNSESGYSRVRTPRGLEGWIQSQYLVSEPIARDVLNETRKTLGKLESDYQALQSQIESRQKSDRDNADQILTLRSANNSLNDELTKIMELAANVIAIDQQNDVLQDELELRNMEIEDLMNINKSLSDTSDQSWFLRGAATILLGLLFGFWVARIIYNNQRRGWR